MKAAALLRRPGALLGLLTALACGWLPGCSKEKASRPAPEIAAAGVAGVAGAPFHLSGLRGQVVLLTFGYTFCPDVCPTTLSTLKGVRHRLGDAAAETAVVFVTVDPARDRPERLRSYVKAFDPAFHSVFLEGDALVGTLDAYDVTVRRRLTKAPRPSGKHGSEAESYALDHSAGYWLIDRRGFLRERVAHGASVETLTSSARRLLEEPPPLRVEAQIARLTPNGLGAVYLKVVNAAGRPDRLLSATTSAAARVELHEVVSDGDVTRMEPRPNGFELDPEEGLLLEPGGKHLMLYGVEAGAELSLALEFESAGPLRVAVPVRHAAGEWRE